MRNIILRNENYTSQHKTQHTNYNTRKHYKHSPKGSIHQSGVLKAILAVIRAAVLLNTSLK